MYSLIDRSPSCFGRESPKRAHNFVLKSWHPNSPHLRAASPFLLSAIALDTESLLDYGEEDEAYLYLDPKLKERADPAATRARGPPREVIVFMIGGGCYSEYQNLQVRRANWEVHVFLQLFLACVFVALRGISCLQKYD